MLLFRSYVSIVLATISLVVRRTRLAGDRVTAALERVWRRYQGRGVEAVLVEALSRAIWEIGYTMLDGRRRVIVANSFLTPYMRQYYQKLIEDHPCDLIVSCHPIPTNGFLDILEEQGSQRTPFISVVTDLVTTPAFWYDRRSDKIIVATEYARQRGLKMGMREEQFEVFGLPVADRFCHPDTDRRALRQRLGWPQDLPIVLLVGGGEGMGPMSKNALAIDKARLPAGLVVVCGRNWRLRERLKQYSWSIPSYIYGFVKEMPDFMAAADILVTKAGPGTISEAFIAGIPLILYSRMPGQEDGNVAYVIEEGAGIWAPQPKLVVEALRDWLKREGTLPKTSTRAASSRKPHLVGKTQHGVMLRSNRNL